MSSLPPTIGIVLASAEEYPAFEPALATIERLGCAHEEFIGSVWAAPERLLAWAERAAGQGVRVILAAAGREPQMAGFVAAASRLPVIAVPLNVGGAAPELGVMLNTSPAAPVAAVATDQAEMAALLAVRILATSEPALGQALEDYRQDLVQAMDTQARPLLGTAPAARLEDAPLKRRVVDATPAPQRPEPDPEADWDAFLLGEAAPAASALAQAEPEAEAPAQPVAERVCPSSLTPSAIPEADPEPTLTLNAKYEYADGAEGPLEIRPANLDRPLTGQPITPVAAIAPVFAASPGPKPKARYMGRLRIDPDAPDYELIEDAVNCLLEGGLIAFPTDTVYGVAADATNPAAVEALYELKGQPRSKALTLLVDSPRMLSCIACNLTTEMRRMMEAFWPGALTIIFKKRGQNFFHISSAETIGVRMPDHSVPLSIMQALARPLACASANLAGLPEALSADEIEEAYGDQLNLILDAGKLALSPPSTVVDVTGEPYRILRRGALSHQQLAAIVGDKLELEG